MRHLLAAAVVAIFFYPGLTAAQDRAKEPGPNFNFRFAENRRKQVEITYVDPAGLGRLMDLREGDVFLEVNRQRIGGNRDLVEALRALQRGGRYTILVERRGGGRVALKGEIRESKVGSGSFYVTNPGK